MKCKAKGGEGEKLSKTISMTGLTTTDMLHFISLHIEMQFLLFLQNLSAHPQFPFLLLKVT
jgi:hypothetical protein